MTMCESRRPLADVARAWPLVLALALGACGGGGGGDPTPEPPPPPTDPQYLASLPTPFAAGCDAAPSSGTLYVNTEIEPYVAVNPRNSGNLVGVWQQDRWSNGGARGLMTGVSVDGGRTWAPAMAPFSRCAGGNAANGGDYARTSDPWVTFAPNGTAYQIALSFSGASLTADSSNAILVSRSADGGRTWSNPVTLRSDGEDHFNDKESITADRTDARYVYAVWDRLGADDSAPAWFARTVDGGASWEPARMIYDPGPKGSTIDHQIVVLADGTLVDFFTRFGTAGDAVVVSLDVIRSLDKGVTWSPPIAVATAQAIGARDPEIGTPVRDGAMLGAIAAGAGGELAVVWQDARFNAGLRDAIAFARSTDGGLTWSAPARINRDPTVQAFLPSVAIRADGTIGVAYYDFRSNTSDAATLPTDYWLARSTDGGVTWRESRVAGPFDLATAPNAGGLFLGDYQALVGIGNAFVPFYAQTTGAPGNRTDVFASLVTSAGAAQTAQRDAIDGVTRAQTADALPMTPELRAALDASVRRTRDRRRVGHPEAR